MLTIEAPMLGEKHEKTLMDALAAYRKLAGARIEILACVPDPIQAYALAADGFIGVVSASQLENARKDAELAAETAKASIERMRIDAGLEEGPDCRLEILQGAPESLIAMRCGLADAVAFALEPAQGRGSLARTFDAALLNARLPVLVARQDKVGGTAAIAWDGGLEASRALKSAIPLLKTARLVVLLQHPAAMRANPAPLADPSYAQAFLSRAGVKSELVVVAGEPGDGRALFRAALDLEADLLVAGAYSQLRAAELLFGGVTRTFLMAEGGPNLFLHH